MTSIFREAHLAIELGYNLEDVAQNWENVSLRTLFNLRLLSETGAAPMPLLNIISDLFGEDSKNIPVISELLAGQTGEFKRNLSEAVDSITSLNVMVSSLVKQWVQSLPRQLVKPYFLVVELVRIVLRFMSLGVNELLAFHMRRYECFLLIKFVY